MRTSRMDSTHNSEVQARRSITSPPFREIRESCRSHCVTISRNLFVGLIRRGLGLRSQPAFFCIIPRFGGASMTRQFHILFVIVLILALESIVFAQAQNSSMPGAGTRRAYTLFGDLKVDESQAGDANTNIMFDVILYTRGNEVFSRQRVGNNGRYRFNNVFNGDYYLAVELDNAEIARLPVLISPNSVELIQQDLEFRIKA